MSDHKPVGGLYSCNVWEKPPGIPNSPPKAVKMEFQNVRASELIASDVMTGYSDPYIHFPRQELLDTFVQSGFVAKVIIFFFALSFRIIFWSLPFAL